MNIPAGAEILNWCGEELVLLPQRALWWPARQALFIADPHFGKAATFRAANVPMPDGTAADLARLDELLEQCRPQTLFILGDLLHARAGRCDTMFATVAHWRRHHRDLSIQLILGNHDRHAGLPPSDWNIECVPEPLDLAPFQLWHHPPFGPQPALAGHLHPKFKRNLAGDRVVAPCFLLRAGTLILPAFSSFVDSLAVEPQAGDDYYVIAGDALAHLPATKESVPAARATSTRSRPRSD